MKHRAAALALFLFTGAAPAFADPQSEALLRDFVGWVDSSPDWSAAASVIRSEGDDTIAEGVVLTRSDPQVSVSLEELRLTGLEARTGGGFTASKIEIAGGGVLTDTVNVAIPSGSVVDVSMPSFAGLSFDPKQMMTVFARYYSAVAEGQFGEARVPEVTIEQRQEVPGTTESVETRITYRNLWISGLSGGVVARQQVGPISIAGETPGEGNFTMEIETVEADRIDIGAFAHVLDPARYRDGRGDGIWRPVMARAAYRGLSGSGGKGATFTLEEAAIENLDGRQTDEPFTEAWDRLLDPDIAQEAKDDLALDAASTMFSAWRVGNMRMSGLAVDAPEENASFSLASMTLTGWSSAGFDSFILGAIRAEGPGGFFRLSSLELAGFVAPDLKALVRFAGVDKDLPLEAHASAIRDTFAALPRLDHFGFKGVVAGRNMVESVALDSFALDFRDWNEIFAGATDMSIVGLKVPRRLLELDQQTTQVLETLGYDDLVFGMSFSDRWRPEEGSDDATWRFTVEDAADIELSYSLTGITADWLIRATAAAAKAADSNAALLAMVSELRLTKATLSVTDRSLLDRAFKVVAEMQGITAEGSAYREQMRAALPFIISAAVPTEVAELVTEPLQAFMAGGQRLLAEVAPPSPLGLLELLAAAGDPLRLPVRLNLTLRSEAP